MGSVIPGRRGGRGAGIFAKASTGQMTIELLLFIALGFALGYYIVAHFFASGGAPA